MPARRCSYSLGLRRRREQHEAREERRHRVGEDHLADDAVGLLVGVAALVVPVADAQARVAQVLPRVLVLLAPRVEVGDVLRVEELAVRLVVRARVRVGRDDRVVVRGRRRHDDPPGRRNAASFVPHPRLAYVRAPQDRRRHRRVPEGGAGEDRSPAVGADPLDLPGERRPRPRPRRRRRGVTAPGPAAAPAGCTPRSGRGRRSTPMSGSVRSNDLSPVSVVPSS